jgi:DNA replication protein DnaC
VRSLPPLPTHIHALTNADAVRADQLSGQRTSPQNCITCRGSKTFKWYVDKTVEEFHCNCEDQWILHRWLLASGLLTKYQRYFFGDIATDEGREAINNYLQNFESYIRCGIGMVLHGKSGTGKTLISTLMAKTMIYKGVDAYFTTFSELIGMSIDGWKDDDAKKWFYKRIKNASFLVIDEVGREMKAGVKSGISNVSRSLIDEVIRHRVGMSLPTVLTTNESLDKIAENYGLSILSLLNESALTFNFMESDYRVRAKDILVEEAESGITRPITL